MPKRLVLRDMVVPLQWDSAKRRYAGLRSSFTRRHTTQRMRTFTECDWVENQRFDPEISCTLPDQVPNHEQMPELLLHPLPSRTLLHIKASDSHSDRRSFLRT